MPNALPELEPQLKQLRLSGVLDSLSLRNKEALEHKLSYLEFLALILQDETLRREQRKYETRLRRANFQGSKTIENYDFSFNPKTDQRLIKHLASCRFVTEKAPILIVGPCGTGKSHIAQALGHCAIQRGIDVLFTTQAKLSNELQAAKAIGSFQRKSQALYKVPLLIVDDFGLYPFKPTQDEDFHTLISERYERACTVVTSNLSFNEWLAAFPNRLLGIATMDRLRHNAHLITLEGKSYRTERKAAKTDEN